MKINVNMKKDFIYDLLLYDTYSKFSGFMVNILGFSIIIVGGLLLGIDKISLGQGVLYVFAGILFLSSIPFKLNRKASKILKSSPVYQSAILYHFDENGIEEEVFGNINHYKWEQIERAVSTPKNIAFYLENQNVLIIPKENFKENFMPVMKLISENIARNKIYIR